MPCGIPRGKFEKKKKKNLPRSGVHFFGSRLCLAPKTFQHRTHTSRTHPRTHIHTLHAYAMIRKITTAAKRLSAPLASRSSAMICFECCGIIKSDIWRQCRWERERISKKNCRREWWNRERVRVTRQNNTTFHALRVYRLKSGGWQVDSDGDAGDDDDDGGMVSWWRFVDLKPPPHTSRITQHPREREIWSK